MARGIQLHCNRHVAIDVPVCVDWFLTFQRDKMSFLERSQWLGAFQNCFRVRCEVSTREIPSAKKKTAPRWRRERARVRKEIDWRSLSSRVYCLWLISSMRDPALFKDLRPFPPKQVRWNPPGGGLPHETDGDACRKFWIKPLKETIWAWLKLFVSPKKDQSGRGLSKFWPLKETA